jgi:hypothetical protein
MQVLLWNMKKYDLLFKRYNYLFMLQGFHSCWLDLRTQLLAHATSSGAPVMRHMFFHYWQGLSLSDMPSQALEFSQSQVFQTLHVLALLRDVLTNCVSVPSWRLAPSQYQSSNARRILSR